MSFIADRVVMDGLTFDDILLIPASFNGMDKLSIVNCQLKKWKHSLKHINIW